MTEPSAAALTALRMTPQIRTAMASALAEMTGHGPGAANWHDGRRRFHELVLIGGRNELLAALWPSIQVILQWVSSLRTTEDHVGTDDEVTSAYANALARIVSGDAEVQRAKFSHSTANQSVETA